MASRDHYKHSNDSFFIYQLMHKTTALKSI